MTVVVDDHLLRDWLARRDQALMEAIAGDSVATTNLWYARLCKSAARAREGALLGGWSAEDRRALVAALDLSARVLVSARDDGPGIRRCAATLGVSYHALPR